MKSFLRFYQSQIYNRNIRGRKSAWLLFLVLAAPVLTGCAKEKPVSGKITFILGDVSIVTGEITKQAAVGDNVNPGDVIVTAKDSMTIVQFGPNSALLEIQSEARLTIEDYTKKNRKIFLEKGNVWTKVFPEEEPVPFTLQTPVSVAGVRGTRFYTFTLGDIYGTCFCHGKVSYTAKTSGFNAENDQDYIVLTRNDRSIILTQAELTAAGLKPGHNHSMISDSPLGEAYSLTPDEEKIFSRLIEEKFSRPGN